MGFFDKIKSAVSAVTGGAAKVYIEVGQAQRGFSAPVKVRAVAEGDLKVDSVYVLVRAMEHAEVMDTDMKATGGIKRERVRGKHTSYEHRAQLAGATTLEAGREYTWEGQIEIPGHVAPSFKGSIIRHVWEVQAGLDAFGNDPDSGWQEVQVS